MRSFVVCALMLVMALGVASAQNGAPPPLLENVHRVVCLGDSITQAGEGPGGYVWLVRHYLQALYPARNIEVINAGISGHKSNDMLARYQRDVLDRKPDLITISVGVNDVWHGFYDNHPLGDGPGGIPLDAYRKNVETMIQQGKAIGARIVVLSTTVIYENLAGPENAKLVEYNRALRELAHKYGCTFVDYQKPFQALIKAYRDTTGGRDLLLTVDGVHMNGAGNKVMAYALLGGLGISPEAREAVRSQVEKDQRDGKP